MLYYKQTKSTETCLTEKYNKNKSQRERETEDSAQINTKIVW
jgi:hypothetical protein